MCVRSELEDTIDKKYDQYFTKVLLWIGATAVGANLLALFLSWLTLRVISNSDMWKCANLKKKFKKKQGGT